MNHAILSPGAAPRNRLRESRPFAESFLAEVMAKRINHIAVGAFVSEELVSEEFFEIREPERVFHFSKFEYSLRDFVAYDPLCNHRLLEVNVRLNRHALMIVDE